MRQARACLSEAPERAAAERIVSIERYRGDTPAVLEMSAYLQAHLSEELAGAYVLGSLGTGEEIAYSDFDALAVVRDDVFADARRVARAGRLLSRARRIMFEHDPLQHHGWFVITEGQFECYRDDYLPLEVLRHGKALLPAEDHVLRVRELPAASGLSAFERLATAVHRRVQPRHRPRNLYELKGLLSQVMLLPARYVQARDGRGVFKKSSFDAARRDFDPGEWRVMDDISTLRSDWTQEVTGLRRKLLVSHRAGIRRVATRFAPAIPSALAGALGARFYDDVARLVTIMQRRVAALTSSRYRRTSVSAS